MRNTIAMLLAFVALAGPGRLFAQTEADAISGAVVSSGNTALVIDADDGTKRTFLVDTTTILPGSLAAGNRVMVQFKTLDADRAQAVNVSLLTPDATAASTAPSQAPAAAPVDERPGSPGSAGTPVSLMGIGIVALAAIGVVAWVFTRGRREEETPHFSL